MQARFAFSQFVNAIGTTVAELVPQFVGHVVTEFEPAELVDFLLFLGLLMHRLKVGRMLWGCAAADTW
jgi:exportin-T